MDWFEKIKQWHTLNLWNDEMVQNAVTKGKITQEQANLIIGGTNNVI